MEVFLIYFMLVSLISVIVTAYDKSAAKRGKRRVRERTLMLLSLFGGSVAMYLTMLTIRHKTKHKKFTVGIPLIIILQLILAILLMNQYCHYVF